MRAEPAQEVGLGRLMDLCNNAYEGLRMNAVALVKLIAPDLLRPENDAIAELDQRTAASLECLVQGEIQQYTRRCCDLPSLN